MKHGVPLSYALGRLAAEVHGIQWFNRGQIADVAGVMMNDMYGAGQFSGIARHQFAGHFYVRAGLIEAALVAQLDRIVQSDAGDRGSAFPAGSYRLKQGEFIGRKPSHPVLAHTSTSREKGPNH